MRSFITCAFLVLFSAAAILTTASIGALGGHRSGLNEYERQQSLAVIKSLQEQYVLGLQDMDAGRFDLARQRFEYVLDQDPSFPNVADKLVQVMQIEFATATPTQVPPTATLTPTPDLRPVQDLFSEAQSVYAQKSYSQVIDILLSLRKADPGYKVVDVDSLLFRSLRYRGLQKIREESNLEGGMYDLALAERFGPLDRDAENWRNLARLYVIGSGFWEVYPEQAVYYFSQVASAAPGLRDGSGWTAAGRLWASLVQYGDWLAARDEWCPAEEKYEAALAMRNDGDLQTKVLDAELKCSPPTNTPPPSPEPSETPTGTIIFSTAPVGTPTDTTVPASPTVTQQEPIPSDTPGGSVEPSATSSPTTEAPPPPTDTQPPPPSDTPPPQEEPTSTTGFSPVETPPASGYLDWLWRLLQ
jgi:tetratricopeptide (TPR) repeat protein